MKNTDLYSKYDLLLPSKFDGGYLIIALYEKIKNEEIEEYFTSKEIEEILVEISVEFQQDSVRQWGRLKGNLFHFFLRNHPDEPWKYYLTDYSKNVVELMRNKLENPYKDYPLKASFEDSFTIKFGEIKTIDELERKFGRVFIQGSKKIITDHLEALADELKVAYYTLNDILRNDEDSATALVRDFAITFKKFGDRAEDITSAIISKDRFIKDLQAIVDTFYSQMEDNSKFNEINLKKSIDDWERSRQIYQDINDFFNSVDEKIIIIRRQIYHASGKLNELQEQFSLRAHFRLQIKKLFGLALESSTYQENSLAFHNLFPLKKMVFERSRILYPKYWEFDNGKPNVIFPMPKDEQYETEQRAQIEMEINRQQIINDWVEKAKCILIDRKELLLDELMNLIIAQGSDIFIAYEVATKMTSYASEDLNIDIEVQQELISLPQQDLALWKTKITRV